MMGFGLPNQEETHRREFESPPGYHITEGKPEYPGLSSEDFEAHKTECNAGYSSEFSRPLTYDYVANVLSVTVKRDNVTKVFLFADVILTFTDEEQFNSMMAGESTIGKSYLQSRSPNIPARGSDTV